MVGLAAGCLATNERKWGKIGCGFCGSETVGGVEVRDFPVAA